MNHQRAVIDIGSNTIRLVIYGGPPRVPVVELNEKVTARLGRGVAANGQLSDKSMGVALAALQRFATLLDLRGITRVDTLATAAVRDASNGEAFLDRVRHLGLSPRLLSGAEEARTSAMGVIGAFPGARGVVADLGGGSIELIRVRDESCSEGATLPFGTLMLPQLRAWGPARFARRIRKAIGQAGWEASPGETLYLVGGAHRALARVAMVRLGWPLDDPHGFELDGEEAARICRSILRGKELAPIINLSSARLAGVPDTAALLAALLRELQPARLVFSSWGLREGALQASLPRALRAQDPLTSSISSFAEAHGCSTALAVSVAGWCAAAAQIPEAPRGDEAGLRLAATMLALATNQVEPNYRVEESLNWALRKRWIGINAEGRAMLAAAAIANAGRTAVPDELMRLASPVALRRAIGWGLAIRICRRFTGGAAPAITATSLEREDRNLILKVPPALAPLINESAERDLAVLANWLELIPVLERG